MALLDSYDEAYCGGTLVASKYVISAAHCMFNQDGTSVANTDIKVELDDFSKYIDKLCSASVSSAQYQYSSS